MLLTVPVNSNILLQLPGLGCSVAEKTEEAGRDIPFSAMSELLVVEEAIDE